MTPPYFNQGIGRPKPRLGSKVGLSPGKQGFGRPQKPRMKGGIGPTKPKQPGQPQAPVGPSQPPVQTLNDSRYNTDINQAQTGYNDANLALQNQEYGVRESFGFDPQFANNPYTRANMLARAANQRFNSTTNSMAGRRQLYSGATDRARSADAFTSGAETDAARREYGQALSGIEGQRLAAQREMEGSAAGAYSDMIERALENEPDPDLFGDPIKGGKGKSPVGGKGKKKSPLGSKVGLSPGKMGIRPAKPKVDPGFTRVPVKYPKKGRK